MLLLFSYSYGVIFIFFLLIYHRGYHLIVWGLPLIPAVIPLAFQAYAPAGAWCWIVETQVLMRFVLWYIPMLILLIGIGA